MKHIFKTNLHLEKNLIPLRMYGSANSIPLASVSKYLLTSFLPPSWASAIILAHVNLAFYPVSIEL